MVCLPCLLVHLLLVCDVIYCFPHEGKQLKVIIYFIVIIIIKKINPEESNRELHTETWATQSRLMVIHRLLPAVPRFPVCGQWICIKGDCFHPRHSLPARRTCTVIRQNERLTRGPPDPGSRRTGHVTKKRCLFSDAGDTRGVGEVVRLAISSWTQGSTSVSAARGRGHRWPRVLAYGMTTRWWVAWDPQRGCAEVKTFRPISQTQHVAPE